MIYDSHNKVVNSDVWIYLFAIYTICISIWILTNGRKKQIFMKNLIYNLDVFNFEIKSERNWCFFFYENANE